MASTEAPESTRAVHVPQQYMYHQNHQYAHQTSSAAFGSAAVTKADKGSDKVSAKRAANLQFMDLFV